MGCSSRLPEYREVVRARMLRDSAYGGCRRRRNILADSAAAVAGPELGHARRRSRSVSRWDANGNCTSYRLLRCGNHRDRRHLEGQLEVITDAPTETTWFAPGMSHLWSGLLQGTKDVLESRTLLLSPDEGKRD